MFDVIYCLTVLRDTRLDDEPSIRELYPFERFDERVRFLHSLLRPAGLLVFYGNMYRFRDTSVAQDYEVIPLTHTPVGKNITFARDGTNDGAEYMDVLFRKKLAPSRVLLHTARAPDQSRARAANHLGRWASPRIEGSKERHQIRGVLPPWRRSLPADDVTKNESAVGT